MTPYEKVIGGRGDQAFPVLSEADLSRIERFGERRRYRRGERLFAAGERTPGMFVVLKGALTMTARDGLGRTAQVVRHGPGQFTGEVAQLSTGVALVDAEADDDDVEALLIPPDRLHALIVAEAELGERIVRALILRRVAHIESGGSGPVLIGDLQSPDMLRLENFLRRNGQPHHAVDPSQDKAAALLLTQYGAAPRMCWSRVRTARCSSRLRRTRLLVVSACWIRSSATSCSMSRSSGRGLPASPRQSTRRRRDCGSLSSSAARSGAKPARARASRTISAFQLASQVRPSPVVRLVQAQKFGAQLLIPAQAASLDCARTGRDGELKLKLKDGRTLRSRTVVIASGARYRRPAAPRLAEFEGRGIWYWASPLEAKLCVGEEVALIGGGNSAGQAAVFLSGHASRVHMLIRGEGLAASMSRYLIDRIAATPSITLHPNTDVSRLCGDAAGRLASISWRDKRTGIETTHEMRNLFVFIGADPETEWLGGCGVKLDAHGFVFTGAPAQTAEGLAPAALESSVPGVYAVGDVRSGSVKRVGGAIGEGAAAVALIHAYLSKLR